MDNVAVSFPLLVSRALTSYHRLQQAVHTKTDMSILKQQTLLNYLTY